MGSGRLSPEWTKVWKSNVPVGIGQWPNFLYTTCSGGSLNDGYMVGLEWTLAWTELTECLNTIWFGFCQKLFGWHKWTLNRTTGWSVELDLEVERLIRKKKSKYLNFKFDFFKNYRANSPIYQKNRLSDIGPVFDISNRFRASERRASLTSETRRRIPMKWSMKYEWSVELEVSVSVPCVPPSCFRFFRNRNTEHRNVLFFLWMCGSWFPMCF